MPAAPLAFVVDDDPVTRLLLASVLTSAGMSVKTFASAAGLLDEGRRETADVLLLALSMPGMSGLELHQLLLRQGVDVPVLFISEEADRSTAVAAMRNGAADLIEKPFQGPLLIESVRLSIARHTERVAPTHRKADPLVLGRFDTLTQREREVFHLLVTGMGSKTIARELGGSFRSIEIHRDEVLRKMMARHLPDLVRMGIEYMAARQVQERMGSPGTG